MNDAPVASPADSPTGHDPVLAAEVLDALFPPSPAASESQSLPVADRPAERRRVIVDGTLGRGGHARLMAERMHPRDLLIGIDQDPRNLEFARTQLADVSPRVEVVHANFRELGNVLKKLGVQSADGILVDLGVSTNQLFDPHYGLSFREDMPLDMRLDPRLPLTAGHIVNTFPEKSIADLIFQLSDERHSRKIARKIVAARSVAPISTTKRLAELVRSAIPLVRKKGPQKRGGGSGNIDPATRTFMALRMKVNGEVENLTQFLQAAPLLLSPGGRLAVISFHSVEDRLAKQAILAAKQSGLVEAITRRPITPGEQEELDNPRSRSAKLRVAERTGLNHHLNPLRPSD